MSDVSVEASVPALVLAFPKPIDSDSDCSPKTEDSKEEHEGNVFVGLKFAMIIYLMLAVGIAAGWKLFHLF